MLTGKCPKCGWDSYGWKLRFSRNQMCVNCGAAVEIFEDGTKISDGYSPFTAEEYKIGPSNNMPIPSEKTEDNVS